MKDLRDEQGKVGQDREGEIWEHGEARMYQTLG